MNNATARQSADGHALASAIDVVLRAAAFDTGALEGLYETDRGFTYSVAVQEAAWLTRLSTRDERLPDLFEAQIKAFALTAPVADKSQPVTESWIRQVHEIVTGPQATYHASTATGWQDVALPKGEYKQLPNRVRVNGGHRSFARPEETPAEMDRLAQNLRSAAFLDAHAVVQSAYAHYALTAVHPFADGNGRVARVLGSLYIRRPTGVPLLIWADQRDTYVEALKAADRGDHRDFTMFTFDTAVDGIRMVRNELGPPLTNVIEDLRQLHVSHGGLSYVELDAVGNLVADLVQSVLHDILSTGILPTGISGQVTRGANPREPLADATEYRHLGNNSPGIIYVQFTSSPPAGATFQKAIVVSVARRTEARYAFQLQCNGFEGTEDLRLRDVRPVASAGATFRTRQWLTRLIAEFSMELKGPAEAALHQAGY